MEALIPLTDLFVRNKRNESPMQLIARDLPRQPRYPPIMEAMKHRVFEQLAEQERQDLAQSIAGIGHADINADANTNANTGAPTSGYGGRAVAAPTRRPPRSL